MIYKESFNKNNIKSLLQGIVKECEIVKTRQRETKKCKKYLYAGAGFDCETSRVPNTDYSYVYIWQFGIGNDKNQWVIKGGNPNDFITLLVELSQILPKETNLLVYDANISYEWAFFKEYLKPVISDVFAKTERKILSFTVLGNIEFKEALGVWGYSLDNIAKTHTKTQKLVGDLDYDLVRIPNITPLTEQEEAYCDNDVLILIELGIIAHDVYTKNKKDIPLTQTGIIRQEIKDNCFFKTAQSLKEENAYNTRDKGLYKFFREFLYTGGLTHSNANYVGDKLSNVRCYDLTSAYPWALNRYNYPSGKLVHVETEEEFNEFNYAIHKIYLCTFACVRSKSTHSYLSKHKCIGEIVDAVIDNGRILSAGCINVLLNEVDMNNFLDMYTFEDEYEDENGKIWKTELKDGWYFTSSKKCPKFILDVMNKYYEIKNEIKMRGTHKTTEVKEYTRAKQMVNCVYGMLCTQIYDSDLTWDNFQIISKENEWDIASKTIFNCFIGFWCTSYVRRRLIEVISKYPDYVVQYDTDSIYCLPNKDLDDYVKNVNQRVVSHNQNNFGDNDVKNDLGIWDDEGLSKFYMPCGAKRYLKQHTDEDIQKTLNKNFYSKNIEPTEFDIMKATYSITFAGANEDAILKEVIRTKTDIFEYMKDFSILSDSSDKTTVKYMDTEETFEVTDYLGNKGTVTIPSCATITDTPFSAKIINNLFELMREVDKHGKYNKQ